jgi:sensor c-di-GMP phosphodiesterase-like protein
LVSLDDFGTGYSSLAYLRDFPFDVLKIDKKFIENLSTQKDIKLLKAIIDMAEILDMKIVIEGIEKKSQLNYIKQNDENIKYQGFYFYKPMEFKDLQKLL